MVINYGFKTLPEGLTPDTVIRIGHIEAPVRKFIECGLIFQFEGTFISTTSLCAPTDPPTPKPNPFSIRELQKRGFKVLAGDTEAQDRVMLQAGAYYRISDALKNGLLNETTQPYNPFKE
ncbi:MAG TPA: hypothetical protein VJ654_07610 [Noviherbaspirillum sp.]|nr:hypothetical protein [Noviherbaspirillum sp.]